MSTQSEPPLLPRTHPPADIDDSALEPVCIAMTALLAPGPGLLDGSQARQTASPDAIPTIMDPVEILRASNRRQNAERTTRASLVGRLRDLGNDVAWKDFFETYWRLLFEFARRAGLSEADAQDVVQETIVSVAKQMPDFQYDRTRCSFKGWLYFVARRRIADHFRKLGRQPRTLLATAGTEDGSADMEAMEGISEAQLQADWDAEWAAHLVHRALERLKREVQPKHFEVFYLNVIRGQEVKRVSSALGVNCAQVYLVKHRCTKLLREAFEELQSEAKRGSATPGGGLIR